TTRDGRIITVESRMALVREQDHHYVLETTHDITDRKRGQEALAESERQYRYLFESNPLPMWVFDLETLKFLAVNQAAIKHYGFGREQFLKMTLKDVRPAEEVPTLMEAVKNYAKGLSRSRIWKHRKKTGEEIRNLVEFIHYYLLNRKVNVIYDLADDLLTVPADRQQLRQLFLNLLTNASDAMPHGGNLTVRTTPGELPEHVDAVVAELVDTGLGISTDDLENIWEPFFTTKPEGKGTGLGLAICRRVVEEHRGTIQIVSEVGKGTSIRIVLPLKNGANVDLLRSAGLAK